MANSIPVARVSAIQGQAFVKGKDGQLRALQVGDPMLEGDVVVTAAGSSVELATDDGQTLLVRADETLTVDAEVLASTSPDATDSALLATGADADRIIQAINEGGNLDELLEETAAGEGAGGADGGPTFVRLLRIAESVDALNYEFDPVQRAAVSDDFIEGGNAAGLGSDSGSDAGPEPVAATVSLGASSSVAEGGSITYTATLSNAAGTPVTITLSNGAMITIAAGQTVGTVSVAAPGDDVYVDASNVSVTVVAASGGDFGSLSVDPTPAVTSVSDTVDLTTASLSATGSVAEGGNITYTATLSNAAETPVTITLSNGAEITIAAGASSGTVSVAAPSDDVYLDAGSVSATITSATGGNFEQLVINPAAAITAVGDTTDTTTVSLGASANVAEGGSITYTATLSNTAETPVTITLSNGAEITIAAGATSGTVGVPAPTDDVYVDAGTVSVTISSASGGNFETFAIDSTPAVTNVGDTLDTTTATLSASASVAEGNSITYTVNLTAPVTGSPVAVTLANGEVINIAVGGSSGSITTATADNVYAGGSTVSNSIATISGGNYENLVADPASVSTTVIDAADITVSLGASSNVAEGGNITYTGTLSHAAETPVTITLSNGAEITIAAGATSGTVSVPAPTDDVYVDAGTVSVTISSASGGNFETFAIDSTPAVTNVGDTLDITTATLSASASVAEGNSITYTVNLTAPVTGSPVAVTLANGEVINIAVGGSSGSITTATADNVYAGGSTVSNSIATISGGNYENLVADPASVSTTVIDAADITVSLGASSNVAEGGNITYTATLSHAAETPVTITLSNGAEITIAAGATSGTVSVPAPTDDVYVDAGNVSATIATAVGGNFENLAINPAAAVTTVSDTIDTTTVSLSGVASVVEGGSAAYTVSLTSPAQGSDVTVTLGYSGTAANGSDYTGTTTVTIPAGSSSANFSIATLDDALAEGSESLTITLTGASGGGFEHLVVAGSGSGGDLTTTLIDNDSATVSLTATAGLTEAGGTITYTASITQVPLSDLTVTLSNGATITILAGATTGSVDLPVAASDDVYIDPSSISATITGVSGGGLAVGIDPTPATTAISDTIDSTTVSLGASASVVEGGNITYTATLSNAAETPVTITLSNGAEITIAAGASSGTVSVPAPTDDVYLDTGSVSATISGAVGGNFENLAIDPAAAVTAISDTLDTTTVSLSATGTVAEGGSITYTATLSNAAETPVTITLNNGAEISIAAGASSGTVSVPAPTDDVYLDAGTVSATISSATGGNFENLTINPAAAVTTVSDTLDTTTATLSASASVAEGNSITYTVNLTAPVTGSPVTVILANGEVINIAVGASSGSITTATADNVYAGSNTVSNSIATISGGNYENLVANGTPVSTVVTDELRADITTVSLSATGAVAEGGSITYTATLSNAAETPVTITLNNGAEITIAAGQTVGTVSVPAPTDDVYVDAGTVSATISSATGGNFENLAINPAAAVTTVSDTLDTTTVSLSGAASVVEGGSAAYTVSLTSPAQGSDVTVNLSYSGTAANGSDYTGTTTVTIPAGSSSANFSIATLDDALAEGSESLTITLTGASGGGFEHLVVAGSGGDLTTILVDNDPLPTISSVSSPTATEGIDLVYTVNLSSGASTTTSFAFDLGGGSATAADVGSPSFSDGVILSGGNIIVPPGVTSFTVTLPTVNDSLNETSETVPLTIGSATGTGTIVDNDALPGVSIDDVTVDEAAGTATFTVTLSAASGQTVTVGYNTGNGTATVGSDYTATAGSLTFAPGQTTQTVTVSIVNDAVAEGATGETFTVNLSGATNATIADTVGLGTIVDNDTAPTIDLDVDNSTASGVDFHTSYSENAPAVAIADADIGIVDVDGSDITGAMIRLNNAQAGDLLTVGGLPAGVSATVDASVAGVITVTLTGAASPTDYQDAIRAVAYSNTSETPATVERNISISLSDGVNTGNTATATIAVVSINDIPVTADAALTTSEDTGRVFALADFSFSDADSGDTLHAVRITGLPADGTVEHFNGTAWVEVAANQEIPAADIAAGNLRFMPEDNESGADIFGGSNTGDQQATYASLTFQVSDGVAYSANAVLTIDVTPVADAPLLAFGGVGVVDGATVVSTPPAGDGLTVRQYSALATVSSGDVNSAAEVSTLLTRLDGETPASTAVSEAPANYVAGSGSPSGISTDGAYRVSGLIFLEAGKTYTFSSYMDDTSVLKIGGTEVLNMPFNSWGNITASTYTPTTSGYYTLDWVVYNGDGVGALKPYLSVNNGTAVELTNSNFNIYSSLGELDTLGGLHDDFIGSAAGGYYPVSNSGVEDSYIKLSPIEFLLADSDGSEVLVSLYAKDMLVGTTISDGTHSFTAVAGNTSVDIQGWNLTTLTLLAPLNFNGTYNLALEGSSRETSTGELATTSVVLPITVAAVNDAPTANADSNAVTEDAASSQISGNVLGNDVDIDGDVLSVQSVDGFVSNLATDVAGAYGTFHVNADGSYTYTLDNTNARVNALNNGQTLTEHLTYTVADPSGETSTAELVVTIDGATDPFSVRPPASTGGNDTLIGGSGNEVIDALAGNDRIESGAGNDVVYAGDSSNTLSFAAVEGHAFMERSTQNLTDNNGALRTAVYEPNADVANGGSGNDALFGESGSDLLYGGAGNDYLSGGDGIDGLRGGAGADRLEGGAGSDVLRGDAGADVFAWSLGDQASTFGTTTAGSGNAYDVGDSVHLSSTADLVTDFRTSDGDRLDLRDLLQGEHHLGENPGNLSDYLHFELSNGNTVVHVSTTGGFSSGYNAASENQTIVLQNVDFTQDSGGVSLLNDNAIVQDLLKNGRLIVD